MEGKSIQRRNPTGPARSPLRTSIRGEVKEKLAKRAETLALAYELNPTPKPPEPGTSRARPHNERKWLNSATRLFKSLPGSGPNNSYCFQYDLANIR